MAASIRATPRNELLNLAGSGLNRIKQALNNARLFSPEEQRIFSPRSSNTAPIGDLLLGSAPEALQDWSYEGSRGPISGRNIQTMKIDPRVLDVAGLAAVGAPSAAKAARKLTPEAAKMVEKYAIEPYQFNVIKPEGGQWLSDEAANVNRLMRNYREATIDENLVRAQNITLPPETIAFNKQSNAYNAWLDGALKKYIRNRMGTPSDEIRKLADQGITHIPGLEDRADMLHGAANVTANKAKIEGIPYEQIAETDLGSAWEKLADYNILSRKIGDLSPVSRETWMSKVDPSERVYNLDTDNAATFGFDHMLDVLRQDLETGRIRPEQVNKVSVEQMVRRTHAYDQEMAKRRAETAAKEQAGLPVVKEYPEQGFKWVELNAPDNPELTEKALKYEGDKMGHCVGGYCDLVKSGDTNIFSLRDSKGEPHVTIEIPKGNRDPIADAFRKLDDDVIDEIRAAAEAKDSRGKPWGPRGTFVSNEESDLRRSLVRQATLERFPEWAKLESPPDIQQIKGKQNRAPKAEYQQYVQDFLNSRQFGEVKDLEGTGLIDLNNPQSLDRAGIDFKAYVKAMENQPEGAPRFLTEDQFMDFIAPYASPEKGFAAGGLVSGDYDESHIDALADDLVGYAEGGEVDLEKLSKADTAKALLKGLGLRTLKYPLMATGHGAYPNKIRKELVTQYPEDLGTKRINRSPLDTAINYGGVYDLASDPRMEPQDLKDMALAYQLWDYVKGDKEDAVRDYQENMAGIAAATSDRKAGRRATEAEVAKRARDYAKQQNDSFPEYAEGGLVYDDSHIDELANQLLGM